MRRHADWMVIVDERILEFLRENGPRQLKQIADSLRKKGLDYNDKYVGRRCLELADYNLLSNLGNGIYTITGVGEDYLDGELSATELEPEEQ